ncbi:unnamed protein product [Pleuronectes platessa]|uniref:Uncharacterized protein n=1 Tax=Pleuronectes platessa TaxID=8262 RepID=A0A9N7US17_PLEPL|nr:unnamed protein product [Pleuronectes platessa]
MWAGIDGQQIVICIQTELSLLLPFVGGVAPPPATFHFTLLTSSGSNPLNRQGNYFGSSTNVRPVTGVLHVCGAKLGWYTTALHPSTSWPVAPCFVSSVGTAACVAIVLERALICTNTDLALCFSFELEVIGDI